MTKKEERYLDNLGNALKYYGLNISKLSLYPSEQNSTVKGWIEDKEIIMSFSPIGSRGNSAHSIVLNIDPLEADKELDIVRRLNEYFSMLPSYRFMMRNAKGIFYEWQRTDPTEAKKENYTECYDFRFLLLNLFEVRCQLLDNGVETNWLEVEDYLDEKWIRGGFGVRSFLMKLGLQDKNGKFTSAIIRLSIDDQESVRSFSKFMGEEPFARYNRKSSKGCFYEWTGTANDSIYDHLIDDADIFNLKVF